MHPPRLFSKISESKGASESLRAKITVHGAVQGVGFRPFVYRLATELRLCGWVLNCSQGVFIEVEGPLERPHRMAVAGAAKSMWSR